MWRQVSATLAPIERQLSANVAPSALVEGLTSLMCAADDVLDAVGYGRRHMVAQAQ